MGGYALNGGVLPLKMGEPFKFGGGVIGPPISPQGIQVSELPSAPPHFCIAEGGKGRKLG